VRLLAAWSSAISTALPGSARLVTTACTLVALVLALRCAAVAGTPGVNGALTVTAAGTVVNLYDAAVSVSGHTIVTTNIANLQNTALGNVVPGSVLMVYQANGATIDGTDDTSAWGNVTSYGNAGNYDFVTVSAVSGNTITINAACTLAHTYAISSTTSTQIVRVPQYSSLTINSGASIAATPWNGTTGGIVAIDVAGATTINGSINVTGDGFAGAAAYVNAGNSAPPGHAEVTDYFLSGETGANLQTALAAAKGESIAGNDATYDSLYGSRYGRGAPANGGGGGNGHNAGGGGGSNGNNGNTWSGQGVLDTAYTAWYADTNGKNPLGAADPGYATMTTDSGGGRGGYTFAFNDAGATGGIVPYPVGGLGGRPMTVESAARVFFGGGGGAGDANNVAGGNGGNGGGIVILNTGTLAGSGSIVANGAAGGTSPQQDAGGGGGGGGSVVITTSTGSGSLATINANGGAGGANDQTSASQYEAEGPGGGGGGGYVAATGEASTITTSGGTEGLSQGEAAILNGFTPYGATQGATGASGAGALAAYCYTPVIGAAKAASVVNNGNRTYTVTYAVVLENYGDTPLSTLTATDPLSTTFPSGTTFSIATAPAVTSASTGASATVNASFNGSTNQTLVSAGTLPVGGVVNLTFSVLVTPPVGSQTYSNSLTASANGTTGNANGVATTDLSDNGTNPDPAGLGQPNQTSENVATPITIVGQPTLLKTVRNVTTNEATGLTADTASPGNQLEYTLSFTNGTGGALSSFSVTDAVPANTTYKSAACGALAAGVTACSATVSAGVVTWRLTGTLNNGATQTFLLDVTVN
jgi:uncharacterized repeat protein (TIGR01451 family)